MRALQTRKAQMLLLVQLMQCTWFISTHHTYTGPHCAVHSFTMPLPPPLVVPSAKPSCKVKLNFMNGYLQLLSSRLPLATCHLLLSCAFGALIPCIVDFSLQESFLHAEKCYKQDPGIVVVAVYNYLLEQ